MTSSRVVVAAVAVLLAVAAVDAIRSDGGGREEPARAERTGYRIDLQSSRDATSLPVRTLRRAFPGPTPSILAVSKVAVAPDDVAAVALSHVPGGDRRSRAAIELWDGNSLLRAFAVPPGSFSLGMWFVDGGDAIATIGWDERARLYDRDGRRLEGNAYFAYETG